ncbi:MAG: hypothetical protein Q8P22_09255 [Chloroflexota bacterium]|nr:hypothetical protein [Chloroflexota bacterium]
MREIHDGTTLDVKTISNPKKASYDNVDFRVSYHAEKDQTIISFNLPMGSPYEVALSPEEWETIIAWTLWKRVSGRVIPSPEAQA